jgi:hypothetical protein
MGVPPESIALPCLTICAGATDDGFKLQMYAIDPTWVERACIWLFLIAPPGQKKSPTMEKAKKPLDDAQELLHKQFKLKEEQCVKDYTAYKVAMGRYEKAIEKGSTDMEMPIEPEEPVKPWLIINDFTMEALIDVLGEAVMDRGVMLYSDEITSMIGSMDAYKNSGVKKDRGIFLSVPTLTS